MLYLIRHGQAEGNAEQRIMGQSDRPLTALGRQTAGLLAQWLAGRGVQLSTVFTSDLRRAAETAAAVAAACGAQPLQVRPDLRELGRGLLEGRTFTEAATMRLQPEVTASFEPETAIAARIRRIGSELRARAATGDVAAVAHGGSLDRLLRFYLEMGSRPGVGPRFRLDNTGVTILRFGSRGTEVICVNALYHLGTEGPALRG